MGDLLQNAEMFVGLQPSMLGFERVSTIVRMVLDGLELLPMYLLTVNGTTAQVFGVVPAGERWIVKFATVIPTGAIVVGDWAAVTLTRGGVDFYLCAVADDARGHTAQLSGYVIAEGGDSLRLVPTGGGTSGFVGSLGFVKVATGQ